ncbi:hypothetical protein SAMN05216583_10720 [Selenomonas sp. KH1T6]|nr:hypothetical protein SAMN05216583_10720 [Selenomonas ruminantium]
MANEYSLSQKICYTGTQQIMPVQQVRPLGAWNRESGGGGMAYAAVRQYI